MLLHAVITLMGGQRLAMSQACLWHILAGVEILGCLQPILF